MTKRSVNETLVPTVVAEHDSLALGSESPAGGAAGSGVRRRIKAMRPGEILDAAFEEFARNGYTAARLEDVARRVGLTKGALYLYFPSKLELFKAVVRSCVQPIFADVEQILASSTGTTADLLRALLDTGYRHVVENRREREMMRLLMAEGAKHPELSDFYFSEVIGKSLTLLERVIARGLQRKEFRRSAVTDMPLVLISPIVHAANWLLMFGDRPPLALDRLKQAHLALILSSLVETGAERARRRGNG